MTKHALSRPMPLARLRPAGARTPGGASSLLRLSSGTRLPSGASVDDWIERASLALAADEPMRAGRPAA